MFKQRPTRAEIDLGALRHNYSVLRACAGNSVAVLPVVKADAYGHGANQVAKALARICVPGFAVATVNEAVKLRKSGIKEDILILGALYEDDFTAIVAGGIIPVLWDEESAVKLSEFISDCNHDRDKSRSVSVQIKIDTGMGRAGILTGLAVELIKKINELPGLQLSGVLSHLAIADSNQDWARRYTEKQADNFRRITAQLSETLALPDTLHIHLANSAGIVRYDFPGCNMARAGIALYGAYPDSELYDKIDLQPVMSVKTGIVLLKKLQPGQSVSYGCTYTANEEITVALLPIGYADGLSRALSGRGEFLLRGQRVPVIGRVCMDWTMVNVTDVCGAAVGDEVVIFGNQGNAAITVDELAATLKTISYEIFCSWSPRVRREYINPSPEAAGEL